MKAQRPLPFGGRHEPSLEPGPDNSAGKAVHVTSSSDKLEALCTEIYRLTGQKVTQDDPILLAALFQSELIDQAGERAAASLQNTVTRAVADLTQAVQAEREQAANMDRTVAAAFQQLADAAKKAGDHELTTMQGRFARLASETLDQVRREAVRRAPGGLRWKLAAALCSGLAAGLVSGVVLGHQLAARHSDEQLRLMHNGLLLDDAWPRLPKAARAAFGVSPTTPNTRAGASASAPAAGK